MKRLDAVTEEQWSGVCEFNRKLLNSFLSDSVELSPKSKKAYESNLKIWFVWIWVRQLAVLPIVCFKMGAKKFMQLM